MAKFMCTHTVRPNAFTRQQIDQFAQAAQQDPVVRGYRSFMNLSKGKLICVMEGPDEASVTAWFKKMGLPVESIAPVELEGDCGNVREAVTSA